MSSSSVSSPNNALVPVEPLEDLFCPIGLGTMHKVETLCCGHSFEKSAIHQWLRRKQTCPVCRAAASILPPNEEIQKMVANASKRAAMQAACNHHHAENGSAVEEVEIEEPPIQEVVQADDTHYLYLFQASYLRRTPSHSHSHSLSFFLSADEERHERLRRTAIKVGASCCVALTAITAICLYSSWE